VHLLRQGRRPKLALAAGLPPDGGQRRLGRYRLVDEIGLGRLTRVHLACVDEPGAPGEWLAIKSTRPNLVADDPLADGFLEDARSAMGIRHANVAQLLEVGKADQTYWVAMEYLHGEPVRELSRAAAASGGAPLPSPLAARICADAAHGLHAAHELRSKEARAGLVHRNVTPNNLYVLYDGRTKVVDFGIASFFRRAATRRTTDTLVAGETFSYSSPEQLLAEPIDRTTDVFSLSVVLWELITNRRLFFAATPYETLDNVRACVVPPPSTMARDCPPALDAIVKKALARNRQDRFATAGDFASALETFLEHAELGVRVELELRMKRAFAKQCQSRADQLARASSGS
jgi:eukaryotic-like serine/threonine-protein kinase